MSTRFIMAGKAALSQNSFSNHYTSPGYRVKQERLAPTELRRTNALKNRVSRNSPEPMGPLGILKLTTQNENKRKRALAWLEGKKMSSEMREMMQNIIERDFIEEQLRLLQLFKTRLA